MNAALAGVFAFIQSLPGGDIIAPALGLGGTLSLVGGGIWYWFKFQTTFTTKLEEERDSDRATIDNLEAENARLRQMNGRMIFILERRGVPVPPDIAQWAEQWAEQQEEMPDGAPDTP